MSDKYTFLTQAPVHRVIGAMAIPTIISMLLTSMYNLVDRFFVGKINTQSTAAVGVVFSVMFFIQTFSLFFGNGSGNYISRQLGAQNTKDAEVMASTGLFYTLVFSLILMLLGWICYLADNESEGRCDTISLIVTIPIVWSAFKEMKLLLSGKNKLKALYPFTHRCCSRFTYTGAWFSVLNCKHYKMYLF